MSRRRTLQVSVYWLADGAYGMPQTAKDMGMARAIAAEDVRLGYDKPGVSEIHIIETIRTVTKYEP